jgi:hypothetical protein
MYWKNSYPQFQKQERAQETPILRFHMVGGLARD